MPTGDPQGVTHQGHEGTELDEGHDRAAIALRVDIDVEGAGEADNAEIAFDCVAQQIEKPDAERHFLMNEVSKAHHGETEIDGQILHAVENRYAGVEDDAGEEVEVGVEAVE